jgi:hypothetical protein
VKIVTFDIHFNWNNSSSMHPIATLSLNYRVFITVSKCSNEREWISLSFHDAWESHLVLDIFSCFQFISIFFSRSDEWRTELFYFLKTTKSKTCSVSSDVKVIIKWLHDSSEISFKFHFHPTQLYSFLFTLLFLL